MQFLSIIIKLFHKPPLFLKQSFLGSNTSIICLHFGPDIHFCARETSLNKSDDHDLDKTRKVRSFEVHFFEMSENENQSAIAKRFGFSRVLERKIIKNDFHL